VTTFELTTCPPTPDWEGEVKSEHEWKRESADESGLDSRSRQTSNDVVGGPAAVSISIVLPVTIIGAVVGSH